MDSRSLTEAELLKELSDRHADALVYDGAFKLNAWSSEATAELEALLNVFKDWRQKIYRFENDLGASVVLYQPVFSRRFAWDVILARFFGREPLTFDYAGAPISDLRWWEVQALLDDIRER